MEITVWTEGILRPVWPRMRQYFVHGEARNGHVAAAGAGLGGGWLASADADTRKSPITDLRTSRWHMWIRPDSTSLCFDAATTGSTRRPDASRGSVLSGWVPDIASHGGEAKLWVAGRRSAPGALAEVMAWGSLISRTYSISCPSLAVLQISKKFVSREAGKQIDRRRG